MRLIIGGAGQGKLTYALQSLNTGSESVGYDFHIAEKRQIFGDFHLAVKAVLASGGDPEWEMACLLQRNPDIVIVCDEVGCGVVPLEPAERLWRETVGRLCCELARQAKRVERVFCGIPMRLK